MGPINALSSNVFSCQIMDWLRGKEGNIRALLSTLGDVLWDGEDRWPKPGMHLMIEPNQVKKMYRNASRVVHPDKVRSVLYIVMFDLFFYRSSFISNLPFFYLINILIILLFTEQFCLI